MLSMYVDLSTTKEGFARLFGDWEIVRGGLPDEGVVVPSVFFVW